MDTVTISLDRFKELETFEQIVKGGDKINAIKYGYGGCFVIVSQEQLVDDLKNVTETQQRRIEQLEKENHLVRCSERRARENELELARKVKEFETRYFWKKLFNK